MMTFFGVTPEQSARSGLPVYEARAGVHAVRFGVGAGFRIDRSWNLGTRIGTSRLEGDAGPSTHHPRPQPASRRALRVVPLLT